MKTVTIVGSGASGVHFALSVLRKGYEVHMIDVGRRKPSPVNPTDSLNRLKSSLDDPVEYFLGKRFESVLFPDNSDEYYGFPPNKEFVFEEPAQLKFRAKGFAPLLSFAQGGLAEAWTGGAYTFNDEELADYPFSYQQLAPYYSEISRRIGINGIEDDLEQFFPLPDHLLDPLDLDEHSKLLMERYQCKRSYFNTRLRCFIGRSRLATLSRDQNGRKACNYSGRCLWGCPNQALYTPSMTLRECMQYPGFHYHSGNYAQYFEVDSRNQVSELYCENIETGKETRFPVETLVLAAGTLMSSKILLASVLRAGGGIVRLNGLMDNRQIMVPFVNLRLIGKRFEPDSYQYHQLSMGFAGQSAKEYVHCQITTLKTAMIHPIVQSAPFGLRASLFLFRHIHAALGLVNVNIHDTRRSDNYLSLEPDSENGRRRLVIHYTPAADEESNLRQTLARVRRALRSLGCVVPPGMTHIRPMGASVHYAGTVPMSKTAAPLTASKECRSHDFSNLFFADGTTFPFLPAKNLTYTLMANAARIADAAF